MTATEVDIAVVGAGIAGLSAAAELARSRRVVVLESEPQPGYHSTGRSAAVFAETYGSDLIRSLTRASRPFFERPPFGFSLQPLLETCGALFIARQDQLESLDNFADEEDIMRTGRLVSGEQALAHCPVLRNDYVAAALWDPAPAEIDVASLLDGYRRQLLERGGSLVTAATVLGMASSGGRWRTATSEGEFVSAVVVNAAGAWADQIAALAGVPGIGLEPRRRTAVLARASEAQVLTSRMLVIDVDEQFYFRAESGDVFVSPADETLTPPCDAQPEELDVAIAIDRLMTATTLQVRSVRSKWAGLRCFVADRNPVVGFDSHQDGFFWLAAQGGYGIQTAPAIASLAAAILLDGPLPDGIEDHDVARLAPGRLTRR
ncbi:MAG: FAD-binding oxidoreductase [Rhizomicrobium sp.]